MLEEILIYMIYSTRYCPQISVHTKSIQSEWPLNNGSYQI